MPKRADIHSVLIIGAGPIIIGQACEFDYSGTQACRVLREEPRHPAHMRPVEIPGETVCDDDRELAGRGRERRGRKGHGRALSRLVQSINRDPVDRAQKSPLLGSRGCLK